MTAASRKRPTKAQPVEDQTDLRPVEASQDLGQVEEAPTEPTQPPPPRTRGPYNVKHVEKKAATYRLPLDAIQLIEDARTAAAEEGNRLTKDDAVTQAIRWYYGKRRRR